MKSASYRGDDRIVRWHGRLLKITKIREELTKQGMAFTDPDKAAFREVLKSAGFYNEWKGKFGDEAWGTLEKAVGASLI